MSVVSLYLSFIFLSHEVLFELFDLEKFFFSISFLKNWTFLYHVPEIFLFQAN
jgi:hypothetical protein